MTTPISLTVNGEPRQVDCAPSMRLSEVLRDFISRAFMQEIAFFPERIQEFVEALTLFVLK